MILPPEAQPLLLALAPAFTTPTFSDALTAVRRWLWTEWVFPQVDENAAIQKLPDELREMLLTTLAPAA
jgi:hypothetical protein